MFDEADELRRYFMRKLSGEVAKVPMIDRQAAVALAEAWLWHAGDPLAALGRRETLTLDYVEALGRTQACRGCMDAGSSLPLRLRLALAGKAQPAPAGRVHAAIGLAAWYDRRSSAAQIEALLKRVVLRPEDPEVCFFGARTLSRMWSSAASARKPIVSGTWLTNLPEAAKQGLKVR